MLKIIKISIHAPTGGATPCRRSPLRDPEYFNPRSHGGSDNSLLSSNLRFSNFNPRSHGGSDKYKSGYLHTGRDFNPRSHGGSDVKICASFLSPRYFNPRSHGGSDYINRRYYSLFLKFQSTLPRGERRMSCMGLAGLYRFQSTLPRGERLFTKRSGMIPGTFQSTLPRGERLSVISPINTVLDFNPRSHGGSDVCTDFFVFGF